MTSRAYTGEQQRGAHAHTSRNFAEELDETYRCEESDLVLESTHVRKMGLQLFYLSLKNYL